MIRHLNKNELPHNRKLIGYLYTWSSVQKFIEKNSSDPIKQIYDDPQPQKNFRNLIDPGAGFGAFLGKLGDALVKAIDKPLGYAVNWGRIFSLWPVHLETGCCSVELGAASSPRYDLERFGVLENFGSLRQCDLIIVLSTVNRKMAPRLRLVYDQMPEPKYVIAMGACAITGGLYFDSYNVLPGVDNVLPADVYVPGCPPRPETLIQAIMLLQEKIKRDHLKPVYTS